MDIYSISNIKIRSVISVETKKSESEHQNYSSNLKYHELIYIASGEAEVVFSDTIFTNKPGDIIFLPLGEYSSYSANILKDERCFDIFFSGDFKLPPIADSQNFVKNTNIPLLFEKLYRTWQRKEIAYYNKCMSLFYEILAEMELTTSKYIPSKKGDRLETALDYIHSHYTDTHFEYERLPSLCGISYTYFKRLFTERFCVTPSEYVRNLKISRACELLRLEQYSVTRISEMCGFSDIYFFSKQFKKYVGVSPNKYKKNLQ